MSIANSESSVLVIIDVQQRLAAAMPELDASILVKQTSVLLTGAKALNVPVIVTEQYPKGLGHTEPDLLSMLSDDAVVIEKTCFSCMQSDEFGHTLSALGRQHVIVVGMESHICVMQTVLALKHAGYDVSVVEDAVCSRNDAHKANALHRMRHNGVTVTNAESVLFEWLGDAKHPEFRALSKLII
jgi:nicotinamidase-related amidase